jgi:hypothetical protein
MAIDSAPKRKSIVGIHFPSFGPGVTPDSTPDQAWRQAAGYSYLGIAADAEGGGGSPGGGGSSNIFASHVISVAWRSA